MLRITLEEKQNTITAQMEGHFIGNYARDAFQLLLNQRQPTRLLVDLSRLTLIDTVGDDVLLCLGRIGVQFVADSAYAIDVCKRLHLPLAPEPASIPPAM